MGTYLTLIITVILSNTTLLNTTRKPQFTIFVNCSTFFISNKLHNYIILSVKSQINSTLPLLNYKLGTFQNGQKNWNSNFQRSA